MAHLRSIADLECARICRATIRDLQSLQGDQVLLSGSDSGLKNVWDEICVQQQGQESFFWQAYLDTITPFIAYAIEKVRRPVQEAIWLQTPEGSEWEDEKESVSTSVPVGLDDITQYILTHYVLPAATDYRNRRIEKYLQRPFDGAAEAGQG